jgi:hypothetical protein
VRRDAWMRLVAVGGIAVSGLAVAGCEPGAKSTTEQTPPVLTWSVLNQVTNEQHDLTDGGKVTSGPGDRFFITFKANDSGGVSRITLGGDIGWSCTQGDLSQNHASLSKLQDVKLHEDANGQVEHYTFLNAPLDPSGWNCDSGYAFESGSATFRGTADNYSNKHAESKITISRGG